MSNHITELADLHPTDQLAPMLAGDLTLTELRAVVVHVRRCPHCQAELVEVAAGYGALQGVARDGLDDLADPPPLAVHPIEMAPVRPVEPVGDAEATTGRTGRRRAGAARITTIAASVAAAVVLVLGGVLVGTRIGDEPQIAAPPTTGTTVIEPTEVVELEPKGPIDATGTVAMAEADGGTEQIMLVDTAKLPPAAEGEFYEVWLLQPDTGQMFAVGVLPEGGSATFAIPADIVANYQAVDVSLQPDDGRIVHSGDSVLGAVYA